MGRSKQIIYCQLLAMSFFAFGVLSYILRNAGVGNDFMFASMLLGSAPSFFHGGFFLSLLSSFDSGLRNLFKNALICIVIEIILEVIPFRIWWSHQSELNTWWGVVDFNDILFCFMGVMLAYGILNEVRKSLQGDI